MSQGIAKYMLILERKVQLHSILGPEGAPAAGRIEGCGPTPSAPFDTRFRAPAAALHRYSGCCVVRLSSTLRCNTTARTSIRYVRSGRKTEDRRRQRVPFCPRSSVRERFRQRLTYPAPTRGNPAGRARQRSPAFARESHPGARRAADRGRAADLCSSIPSRNNPTPSE